MEIPREEFVGRIDAIRNEMSQRKLDALLVYGDEYRKENLRYVSNFWPIFERGACFVPRTGQPILAGAPEGEQYAREMSVWDDLRNLREFACVSVPDEIDFPLATFSTLEEVVGDTLKGGTRLGVVGTTDIPATVMRWVGESMPGLQTVPCDDLLADMRLIKTPAEIAVLKEAGRINCLGYRELIENAVPGNTERMAAGAGEGAARMAGAEDINFMVMGTGARTGTVIGRPTEKVIEDGDMVMASMAVQYEGYVTTVEFPFVAGAASDAQKEFLDLLLEAATVQLGYLRDGVVSGEMVQAVKAVFARHGASEYDVYPPMHGIGLAEAESPYPDAGSTYELRSGMCVNSDISLFGHPGGSNRIEEGFVIADSGPVSLTPLVRELCEQGGIGTITGAP